MAAGAPNGANGSSTLSHPLGPLSGHEIVQASSLVKAVWPEGVDLHFRVITLREPTKAELVPYLTAERAGEPTPSIDRRAFVVYYFRGTVGQPPSSLDSIL
jgi:primary-amine oxidase